MNFLTILDQLIKIRSTSADRLACNEVLMFSKSLIKDFHFDKKLGILWWGHNDLSTTNWLINTHIDVVPGNDNQFNIQFKRDRVFGRGVADVKGCAAAIIEKANYWDSVAKSKKLTFMLVSDEEVGGSSTKTILATMTALKGAVFLEPSNLQITTQAKGMMQVKIVADGIPSHGSRPWLGKNAIELIARGLIQFQFSNPTPNQETNDTTYNFSQISGGRAINQVPSKAELWCDIRYNPADNPSQIINQIEASFTSCDVTLVTCESPILCEKTSSLFRAVKSAFIANEINPLTQFDHGTSDARHATALNIPALVFGPKGGGLHSDTEWVSVKSLYKIQHILDHLINNI